MSLRTLERFYASFAGDWLQLRLQLFLVCLSNVADLYLLVADETTEKKAGKATYGLGCFFSSLFGKPINSVSFLGLSLVSVSQEKSYLMSVIQLIKSDASQAEKVRSTSGKRKKKKKKAPVKGKKRPPGRPKGSKNKSYREPESLRA